MPAAPFQPAYLKLPPGDLKQRAQQALEKLADCVLCPRTCHVNRLQGAKAVCKTGRQAIVSSHAPHFGEEDCLRGTGGSGTIFFTWCSLRCVFCQNFEISWQGEGHATSANDLAAVMLWLQQQGCHNINLVTPEHVVPQILEALAIAAGSGLRLPLVYNSSGYDALESLALLDGVVDIYMPDFKFWDPEAARRYLKAPDYPDVARRALKEMQRQVGPLTVDDRGIAQRGLLLRHLVMPRGAPDTRQIMHWVAQELGPDTYVNLMPQYFPAGRVSEKECAELKRMITPEEFRQALTIARDAGLHRLDARSVSRA